jgi:hypothetical protein
MLQNLKEFKENLQRYVTPDSLATQYFKYEDILARLNFLPLQVRRRHLDAVFSN